MIDTDKYEGHTEGEWIFDSRDWNWAINIFGNDGETIEANAILIQDAPLLLEEVKRLNLRLVEADCLTDTLQTIADNQAAEVKRLREELKEAKDVIQYALDNRPLRR